MTPKIRCLEAKEDKLEFAPYWPVRCELQVYLKGWSWETIFLTCAARFCTCTVVKFIDL